MLNAFPWSKLQLEPRQGFGMCEFTNYEYEGTCIRGYYLFVCTGTYELVVFHVKPGYIPQFAHRALQGLSDRFAMDYPHPLGFWFAEFGQSNHHGRLSWMVCIWYICG